MSEAPLFVGATWVDGDWLAVALDGDGVAEAAVLDDVGDLWYRHEERAERILVDVPIGLPDGTVERRRCDALARSVLGERGDAYLEPPVREATRKQRHAAATRVHERTTGRELSAAAFARSDGIAAIDELLGELPEARTVVGEAHPEVCYRAFAGEPMAHDPATAGGYAERLRTLSEHDRDAPPALVEVGDSVAGAPVGVADAQAALALAYTARPGPGDLRTLPPDPDTDDRGLPMGIHYRSESPLAE
jgi:predicted RNase H-like nuclease